MRQQQEQVKKGFTNAGSQRHFCDICKHKRAPNPKKWACVEKERRQTLRPCAFGFSHVRFV